MPSQRARGQLSALARHSRCRERAVRSRIERRFAKLREEGRAGLVIYLTAGDPDPETSLALFEGLAAAGADLIEIGMPFSDPMADGPSIQAAGPAGAEARHDPAQDAGDGAHACASATRTRPMC